MALMNDGFVIYGVDASSSLTAAKGGLGGLKSTPSEPCLLQTRELVGLSRSEALDFRSTFRVVGRSAC